MAAEAKLEEYFCRRVKEAGAEHRKVKWPGRRNAPDRLVLFSAGLLAWVELKAPGKQPNIGQRREHSRLRARGQLVFVIDNFLDVDRFIEKMTGRMK